MQTRPLGRSGLNIAPVVFGANVFGWTVTEQSLANRLLDRFVDSGLNAIDTADVYSRWVTGNKGGESETIIGNWLKTSSKREKIVLITKVGMAAGLSAKAIREGVEASLRRLQTDRIDLYLSHKPDPAVPIEETLRAYEGLIKSGKVRAVGGSNSTPQVLKECLETAKAKNLPRYEAEQPEYSLAERGKFEGPLRDLCMKEGIGTIVYYSLASGFLSGKYRTKDDLKGRARAGGVEKHMNERGFGILKTLDQISSGHGAKPAEVALAWLIAREGVTAPIASATSVEQVDSLARAAQLQLSPQELEGLTKASS